MKRRTFIKRTAAGTVVFMVPMPVLREYARKGGLSSIDDNFVNPPDTSRAHTWWHWMNGAVTKDGITRDLEAMKKAGVGGFTLFEVSECAVGWVKYGSQEHKDLLAHAASEAERIGVEFSAHNCPGFSSSGGPWNTPELSMQQLVWTETFIEANGKVIDMVLSEPYAKLGYYRDACVLAFPSLKGEDQSIKDRVANVATNSGTADIDLLNTGDLEKGIEINPGADNSPGYLLMEFKEPIETRSVALHAKTTDSGGGGGMRRGGGTAALEVSEDGVHFTSVCELSVSGGGGFGRGTDAPGIADFEPVKCKYVRLSMSSAGIVSDIKLASSARIPQWTGKANFQGLRGGMMPGAGSENLEIIDNYTVEDGMAVNPEDVIDVTAYMDDDGRLQWNAPAGKWTILRMGSTTIGVENHPYPEGGGGLECDKFSKEAIEHHFYNFFGELLSKLEEMAENERVGALIDSYEVGYQNWTKLMPEEFEKRNGYSMITYLPAMTGRVVGSADTSERFLWDLRRTQSDMMADYYYGHFNDLCHQHGMISFCEPYSGGPFEEMQAGSRVDLPMGEFWVGDLSLRRADNIKLASSVAHVNGQSVVGAEVFTGQPINAKWQQYPFSMKAEGDWSFALGINRYFFHRYAMQPHPDAAPGMTMSRWGFHFDRTNTWFPKANGWLDYIARCQYMLQQGLYVADAAYFIGVNAPKGNPGKSDLKPALPEGIAFNTINMEAILKKASVMDGRMVLPHGMSYKLLILPESERMYTVELMHKISDMVNQGMCIYGPKPEGTPGLSGFPSADAEVRKLADNLWGNVNGTTVTERTAGEGKVFWGMPMEDVLERIGVDEDFQYTSLSGDAAVHYMHKKVDDLDFYFLANRRRRREDLVCTFRIDGKQPEMWDAVTGKRAKTSLFVMNDGKIVMPVQLGPAGSVFVVFRENMPASGNLSVSKDEQVILGTTPFPQPKKGLYGNITDNFTICIWLKPEIDMSLPGSTGGMGFGRANTNFAVYPPAGNDLYGRDHVACGLTAGRSGVIVYERGTGEPSSVLIAPKPLSGWTHVAVAYENGIPSIYIDGELAAKGEASGNVVHPGLHEAYLSDGASFYWGDMSKPELFNEVLGESHIKELAAIGFPEPEEPAIMEITGDENKCSLMIWQDGQYTIQKSNGSEESFSISGTGKAGEITTPWKVSFPPNLGAPAEITLEKLMSLHRHQQNGVKYFSGTAVYTNTFTVSKDAMGEGKKLFLDLGRVEVLAQIKVNGQDLGIHWTQPYRIDITDVAVVGDNTLEVLVTNLWPNRLIGDEHLPAENEYEASDEVAGEGYGIIKKYPDWYLKGDPKPSGGRVTFAAFRHYHSDSPLLESGLIGPVTLRTALVQDLEA